MSTRRTNPLLAIAYLRVSTEDQRLGPEAQRAAIEAWATTNGVSVVAWHVDQGISGAAPIDARPALLAALAGLREHGAGLLVVAKRDRIARDVLVAATVERIVAKERATLVSAAGEGNGDAPGDAFMRTIIDAAAAYELALIRARTKAALAAKAARGERVGMVPFGFMVDPADTKRLVPCKLEMQILAHVLTLVRQGMAPYSIAARLAAEGVCSPRTGKPLAVSSIKGFVRRFPTSPEVSA
jgi:DNA invertase Pin-like site-specific DNA recombinase